MASGVYPIRRRICPSIEPWVKKGESTPRLLASASVCAPWTECR